MSSSKKRAIGITGVAIVILAGLLIIASTGQPGAGGSTIGQRVNAAIDNLLATGVRLLEVPTFMLLGATGVAALGAVLLTEKLLSKGRRLNVLRTVLVTLGLVLLFTFALAADRRAARLERDIATLRAKISDSRMTAVPVTPEPVAVVTPPEPVKTGRTVAAAPASVGPVATPKPVPAAQPARPMPAPAAAPAPAVVAARSSTKRTALLFDEAAAKKTLAPFGNVTLRSIIFDPATDAVEIHMDNPLIQAYVAVVDLRTPGLAVHFGGGLDQKTMTSEFAKSLDCSVAINGEAGNSPAMNSGLGEFTGHYMSEGKTILREQPANRRPFLAFTRENQASFTPLATIERAIRPDAYNVVWGRMDALIAGELETGAERDRQPRTAMGLDKDNNKLVLLVVDGRQPRYSVGVTRGEVGMILRAFGAYNGMLCDEGGSSCMIFKGWGMVNSPSDGEERPTYTHFGISLAPPATAKGN